MMALFATRLEALAPALGWTLAHFLWQGALLALLLQVVLRACRTAQARYAWALGALLLMAAAPVATFVWISAGVRVVLVPAVWPAVGAAYAWERIAVAAWLAGVAILAARTAGGLVLVERLRRRAIALSPAWIARCRALQARMATPLAVVFAQSDAIAAPIVAGWLKPMVLIPAAALARLPAAELEALVLHELAHVRRLDAFANLAQIVVETLLFYHPAVWWVSRRIRLEREHCCDDLAVAAVGDAGLYVRALQQMDELRAAQALVLAANGGGRLKRRAARVLGLAAAADRPALSRSAAVLVLSLAAVSLLHAAPVTARAAAVTPPPAASDQPQAAVAATPPAHPARLRRMAVEQLLVPSLFLRPSVEPTSTPAPMKLAALETSAAPAPAAEPAASATPVPAHTVAPITVQVRLGANTKPDASVTVTNDDRFIGYYVTIWPKSALQTGWDGVVTLSCLIDAHGLAERCAVLSETPKNRHFGAAALELRSTFKFDPAQDPSGPVASTKIIRVDFTQPDCDIGRLAGAQTSASHNGGPPETFGGASGAGVGLNAFSACAALTYGGTREVTMLDFPVWAAAPSFDDAVRAYPAKGAGLEGYAAAHCQVHPKGNLDGCFIIRETPGGHDFGKAALALAKQFKVAPNLASAPHPSPLWVDIPIRFVPPGGEREVTAPAWLSGMDLLKTQRVFPPEAADKGITTGRGVARCTVGSDGALTACTPDTAEPEGLGFSQAAVRLASTLKMNLWSADAAPVIGGVVRVPIRLNLAGGASAQPRSGR